MEQYKENQIFNLEYPRESVFYLSEGNVQEIELMPPRTESLLETIEE